MRQEWLDAHAERELRLEELIGAEREVFWLRDL